MDRVALVGHTRPGLIVGVGLGQSVGKTAKEKLGDAVTLVLWPFQRGRDVCPALSSVPKRSIKKICIDFRHFGRGTRAQKKMKGSIKFPIVVNRCSHGCDAL